MNLEKYDTIVTEDVLSFSFISVGPKGHIQKLVIYQHVEGPLYNLAFGDRNGELGTINDLIISDNKDTEKVLATVASTIFDFLQFTLERQYQLKAAHIPEQDFIEGILPHFLTLQTKEFLLYGELDDKIERFIKGKDYRAFLITKKQIHVKGKYSKR